mmetsp:Transcript_1921/g.4116  ORF Transcript_1921/g.4116 Transcript_1921/m.4116 type:complete len:89 (-) Transcript_1921:49-315(-)
MLAGVSIQCPHGPLHGGSPPALSADEGGVNLALRYSTGYILMGALNPSDLREEGKRAVFVSFSAKLTSSIRGIPVAFPGFKMLNGEEV